MKGERKEKTGLHNNTGTETKNELLIWERNSSRVSPFCNKSPSNGKYRCRFLREILLSFFTGNIVVVFTGNIVVAFTGNIVVALYGKYWPIWKIWYKLKATQVIHHDLKINSIQIRTDPRFQGKPLCRHTCESGQRTPSYIYKERKPCGSAVFDSTFNVLVHH